MDMDSNINENRSVIVKIDKIGPVQFLWFTKNQLVTIKKIQILTNFEKLETSKTGQFTIFH
jgi:hypothetical protein